MSKFLKIKCPCGNEQTIFGSAATPILCLVCKTEIARPTGARLSLREGVTVVKVL